MQRHVEELAATARTCPDIVHPSECNEKLLEDFLNEFGFGQSKKRTREGGGTSEGDETQADDRNIKRQRISDESESEGTADNDTETVSNRDGDNDCSNGHDDDDDGYESSTLSGSNLGGQDDAEPDDDNSGLADDDNSDLAAEAPAPARSLSLFRDLTEDEANIVRDAIYGDGPLDQVLASSDTDSVQRKSMQKLKPGVWLNDEVIHYFLLMLARRDAELASRPAGAPGARTRRCHFFRSFFIAKLLDEAGGYNYENVKSWSHNVDGGGDIFSIDKLFFPINVCGDHWTLAVIHMTEKRIQFYDSMSGDGDGDRYLEGLMQYLKNEHEDKKGCPLPDEDEWELVECTADTPQQRNGFDCGVFTCMFCDFLSTDCPLTFSQEHITQCRERIALSIMKGVAIE